MSEAVPAAAVAICGGAHGPAYVVEGRGCLLLRFLRKQAASRPFQGFYCILKDGGTTYSSGLELDERVMIKASKDLTTDQKRPMIVFLSDGGINGGGDPLYYVDKLKQEEPRMILHTIMFGTGPTFNILRDMANIGNGTYQLSLDEVQLEKSFEQPQVLSP